MKALRRRLVDTDSEESSSELSDGLEIHFEKSSSFDYVPRHAISGEQQSSRFVPRCKTSSNVASKQNSVANLDLSVDSISREIFLPNSDDCHYGDEDFVESASDDQNYSESSTNGISRDDDLESDFNPDDSENDDNIDNDDSEDDESYEEDCVSPPRHIRTRRTQQVKDKSKGLALRTRTIDSDLKKKTTESSISPPMQTLPNSKSPHQPFSDSASHHNPKQSVIIEKTEDYHPVAFNKKSRVPQRRSQKKDVVAQNGALSYSESMMTSAELDYYYSSSDPEPPRKIKKITPSQILPPQLERRRSSRSSSIGASKILQNISSIGTRYRKRRIVEEDDDDDDDVSDGEPLETTTKRAITKMCAASPPIAPAKRNTQISNNNIREPKNTSANVASASVIFSSPAPEWKLDISKVIKAEGSSSYNEVGGAGAVQCKSTTSSKNAANCHEKPLLPISVYISNATQEEKKFYKDNIPSKLIQFVSDVAFSTHVVYFRCDEKRSDDTINFAVLYAIATGMWVLKSEWLKEIVSQSRILLELEFEVDSIPGCRLSRIAHDKRMKYVLDHCKETDMNIDIDSDNGMVADDGSDANLPPLVLSEFTFSLDRIKRSYDVATFAKIKDMIISCGGAIGNDHTSDIWITKDGERNVMRVQYAPPKDPPQSDKEIILKNPQWRKCRFSNMETKKFLSTWAFSFEFIKYSIVHWQNADVSKFENLLICSTAY